LATAFEERKRIMSDEWMKSHCLPLSLAQFHCLPRNPAYKYEYLNGEAWLNPRPRYYHALLDLEALPAEVQNPSDYAMAIRPVRSADWERLTPLFADAFQRQQPFGSLEEEERRTTLRKALEHTRSGGDGPWIEQASFVATELVDDTPIGAIFLTLLPPRDLTQWDSYHWEEPPPPDCITRRLGRPHLTWIFVGPMHAGRGIGTALLHTAVGELRALGYTELASTFLLGNDSSMLWHWRNGFRLLAYPGSWRRVSNSERDALPLSGGRQPLRDESSGS
jgi:GNAT superfamily N-acetyltransferase